MKYYSQERRAKVIEAVIAVVIVCLIALAFYEYGRVRAIEKVTRDYESSQLQQEYPPPQSQSRWASPNNESALDLAVPY